MGLFLVLRRRLLVFSLILCGFQVIEHRATRLRETYSTATTGIIF